MRTLRDYLQHRLNPLHIYCRLRGIGMAQPLASRICALYERHVYPISWTGRDHGRIEPV